MDTLKKTFHISLGLLFICIGVLGLVLPILNGILFLILGLIILSFESPYIEEKLEKLSKKNAHVRKWYEKLHTFIKKLLRRI